jgi:hypothetical protein
MKEERLPVKGDFKRVFKVIWAWQDDKEEEWLSGMSRQGWHLYDTSPCVYYFQRGEPLNVTYRLDYKLSVQKDYKDYLSLFKDAGWELVAVMANWHYYRIQPGNDTQPELYNDNRSKVEKYKRLLWTILPVFLLNIYLPNWEIFLFDPLRHFDASGLLRLIIFFGPKILLGYAVIMILFKINNLRHADKE